MRNINQKTAANNVEKQSAPQAAPVVRKRLKGTARTDAIIAAAAQLFAQEGFAVSTRALAKKLDVTQALLYRYFPSKQDLIDSVYDSVFQDRWKREWDDLLNDREQSLGDRLKKFYAAYLDWTDPTSMRLFMRAGLDGRGLPGKRGAALTEQIFVAIIADLRRGAGLPDLERTALMRGERELCMMLHGSIMFTAIRHHVYAMPMTGDVSDIIGLHVETFLTGAPATLSALHLAGEGKSGLQVTQFRPSRYK